MAIYLDANALFKLMSFAELNRLALSLVADQLGQQIILPGLVLEEAAHNYRKSLYEVIDEHEKSVQKLGRYFGMSFSDLLEPVPDVDGAESTWRRRLNGWTTTVESTGHDALGGLHREIHRIPPAKESASGSGIGGRDAAIWLAVIAHHRQSGEPGHLITDDKAFRDGDRLHPALATEVSEFQPIELYTDVQSFVSRRGRYEPTNLPEDELTARAAAAVVTGLEFSAEISHSVWFRDSIPYRQRNHVTRAEAIRVILAKNYKAGGATVTLVNAEWQLVTDVLWQDESPQDDTLWSVLSDVPLFGQIQLYLDDERAQMIGAQLRSPLSATIHGEGVLLIGQSDGIDAP